MKSYDKIRSLMAELNDYSDNDKSLLLKMLNDCEVLHMKKFKYTKKGHVPKILTLDLKQYHRDRYQRIKHDLHTQYISKRANNLFLEATGCIRYLYS